MVNNAPTEGTTMEERRDRLHARLEAGYGRIERALADKDDTTARRYEDFWLALLAEYEDVCRNIQRAV